jgi:hypothetical protein
MLGGGTDAGRFRLQQGGCQHLIHAIHSIFVLVTNREGVMEEDGGR